MTELILFGLLDAVIAGVSPARRWGSCRGWRWRFARWTTRAAGVATTARCRASGASRSASGCSSAPGRWRCCNGAEWGGRIARSELLAFVLAAGMIFLLGLIDDLVGVSIPQKFAVETLAALLVVWLGWHFTALGLPNGGSLELGALGYLLTVLWVVGVTNTINLLDGLDGLAGGVVGIIAVTFVVYAVLQGNPLTVVMMAGIAGACLAFLRHNARGQIFLGDAGSLRRSLQWHFVLDDPNPYHEEDIR